MRFFRYLLSAIFGVVAVALMASGVGRVREQHRKISRFVPAPAKILKSSVRVAESTDSDGHTSYTYYPMIDYTFEARGRTFASSAVTPIEKGGSHKWAHAIVDQYGSGTQQAYYNPDNLAESFLVRRHYFEPYVFILFPMPFLFAAIFIFKAMDPARGRARPPTPKPSGWFEIRPSAAIGAKQNASWIAAAFWWGVGLAAIGHFFAVAEPPIDKGPVIATSIYFGIGLIPAGLMLRYFLLARSVADARVFARAGDWALGEAVVLHLEQAARAARRIDEFKAGLVCKMHLRRKTGDGTEYTTETCHAQWVTLAAGVAARPREVLQGDAEFPIPPAGKPTSPQEQKDYPKYSWEIVVKTAIADSPDYEGTFPIKVGPRRDSGDAPA